MTQEHIHATVFRGGTSKGVYFDRADMPDDREAWDELLLKTFGSPDPMQIDGIGGSHSTTSKAMIVSPGEGDVDIEYLFGQVAVNQPVVDWGGNCGNLTFAIGPFALERGIAEATTEVAADGGARAELTLKNANTGTIIEQSVPLDADGNPEYRGNFRVYGVPGTGARIETSFLEPAGSVTGELFPTGNRVDELDVEGIGTVEASLVDVTSPCVFIRAADVGLTGTELPDQINSDEELLDTLEAIRSEACEVYGFADAEDATAESPGIPKLAFVGEHQSYANSNGETVDAEEFDLLARIMSMQKAHHAYAVTGAMCTSVAASIPGTIPNEFLAKEPDGEVTLGHPKGPLTVGVGLDGDHVEYTTVNRTSRQILDGELYYLP